MSRWAVGWMVGALMASSAAAAAPPREVTDEDVDFVIEEIKRFLWQRQGWRAPEKVAWTTIHSQGPEGSTTALAVFALLEAGANPQDERVRKALDYVVSIKPKDKQVYFRSVRVMALSQVVAGAKTSPYLDTLTADVQWLTQGVVDHGAWGYEGAQRDGDSSNSQFALLALWEAHRAGIQINPAVFRRVERAWLSRQQTDGGWAYAALAGVKSDSTLTMTTAGLASLYICQDVLAKTSAPYPHQPAMDRGWAFLARQFDARQEAARKAKKPFFYINNGYLGFCVQRCAMASGRKFIGEMDWYADGAAKLAEPTPRGRSFGGQWGPIVRASFELIFLARGRIPIVFNKLQHGADAGWNYHTRDLAHFAHYMRNSFERRMRWQIVRITDNVEMLLDAPILLVPGRGPPQFTPEQWDRLREYSLRGGTLLFMPVYRDKKFLESVKDKLGQLYAEQRQQAGGFYRLEALPSDHPAYSLYKKVHNGARVCPMSGVSDGTRLIAVVCERDLAGTWQQGVPTGPAIDHEMGMNFFLYATGGNMISTRLRPVFVQAGGPKEIRYRARVAWLRHGGNWWTQPYALKYLSQKLAAENRVAIDLSEGVPAQPDKLAGHHLVWITGTSKFSMTDEEVAALRQFIDDGGTIFINAVGGSRDFQQSAEEMLDKLQPAGQTIRGEVGQASPLMTGKIVGGALDFRGPRVEQPQRTRALRNFEAAPRPPLVLYMPAEDRIAVIYARYGIHDTLDGHTNHEARSYMPATARALAANVVLYSLLEKPKRVPTTTTSAPAAE